MKRRIRLTESDLRRIVNESVRRVLRESNEEDDYVSTGYAGKDGEIFRNPKNGHVKKVKMGSKYKARPNKVGDYVSTGYAGKDGEIFHNPKNGHIKRIPESDLYKGRESAHGIRVNNMGKAYQPIEYEPTDWYELNDKGYFDEY